MEVRGGAVVRMKDSRKRRERINVCGLKCECMERSRMSYIKMGNKEKRNKEKLHTRCCSDRNIIKCIHISGTQTHMCSYSLCVFTCKHLVHSWRHVHLRQALPALSMIQSDLRTALQRQPHALPVRHHAGHAPTAVCAHLEPVLRRREEALDITVCAPRYLSTRPHTHPSPSICPPTSCTSVVVLIMRTLFCEPHHSFPPTGTILVTGLLGVPRTKVWEDWGSQKLPAD